MLELTSSDLKAIARNRANKKTIGYFIAVACVMLLWIITELFNMSGVITTCGLCITYGGIAATLITLLIAMVADLIVYNKQYKIVMKEHEAK